MVASPPSPVPAARTSLLYVGSLYLWAHCWGPCALRASLTSFTCTLRCGSFFLSSRRHGVWFATARCMGRKWIFYHAGVIRILLYSGVDDSGAGGVLSGFIQCDHATLTSVSFIQHFFQTSGFDWITPCKIGKLTIDTPPIAQAHGTPGNFFSEEDMLKGL